jgi:hypothetical protein
VTDWWNALVAAAAAEPLAFAISALCILVAGIAAGYVARRNEEAAYAPPACAPMRTANSSLIDLDARRALKSAGERPRARAGRSHLKPSYDSRQHAAVASQSPDSPRG